MHHPTDRITHTTAFVTPVVEHWLEREIAQWRIDPTTHRTMSYISLPELLGSPGICSLCLLLSWFDFEDDATGCVDVEQRQLLWPVDNTLSGAVPSVWRRRSALPLVVELTRLVINQCHYCVELTSIFVLLRCLQCRYAVCLNHCWRHLLCPTVGGFGIHRDAFQYKLWLRLRESDVFSSVFASLFTYLLDCRFVDWFCKIIR